METAVERYSRHCSEVARLLSDRGIDEATASTFRFGIVSDALPEHRQYEGDLCIPYLLGDGLPVQLRFRCAGGHEGRCRDYGHPKYRTIAGDRSRPFNVKAAMSESPDLHITEGELDCVILCQLGLNAMALPGASQWQDHYRILCDGFQRVFLWGDPDEAGHEFNSTISKRVRNSRIVPMEGGDINETYLAAGDLGPLEIERLWREVA